MSMSLYQEASLGDISNLIDPLTAGIRTSSNVLREKNVNNRKILIQEVQNQFLLVLSRMNPRTRIPTKKKEELVKINLQLTTLKNNLTDKNQRQMITLFQSLIQLFNNITIEYIETMLNESGRIPVGIQGRLRKLKI